MDRMLSRLVASGHEILSSRRSLTAGIAGVLLSLTPGSTGAKRCRRRLKPCTKKTQCCGYRKGVRCATSHGAGSKTCCGSTGATCTSDLTCCISHLCFEGTCQRFEVT
jgi:hypothetical protein